jgi:hypothetical protein
MDETNEKEFRTIVVHRRAKVWDYNFAGIR